MSDNLKGSLYMALAMAAFAVEDVFFKKAAAFVPVGSALLVFAAVGLCGFVAICIARNETPFPAIALTPPLLVRSAFEITGRLFFALSLLLAPLSTTTAILQATPLIVVLAAAVVLRTRVSMRQWMALAAGLAGVLLILRPTPSGFDATAILAVIATLGFAGRDLATRISPPSMSGAQLGVLGFVSLGLAGVILTLVTTGAPVMPPLPALMPLVAAGVVGVVAYQSLTLAMRTGEIPVVTPFRYTRLLFALVLAVTVFSERPDALTLLGAALVVVSGVYTLVRGAKG